MPGILAQSSSLEDFLNYAFPSGMTSDPGGDQVAWTENRQGARNIFACNGPDFTPKQLTAFREDDGQALSQLCFGGTHIYFVRGGAPNSLGDVPNPRSYSEQPKREISRVPLGGGDVVSIGEGYAPLWWNQKLYFLQKGQVYVWQDAIKGPEPLFKVRGSVHSLTPSPDGTRLAFVNTRKHHALIGIYNLVEKEISFLCPSLDRDQSPVWSEDGRQLAFLRMPYEPPAIFVPQREGLPFSIWVADLETGECKERWQALEGQGSRFRAVSADNQLWWMADGSLMFPWEGEGYTHLYALHQDGMIKNLTPGPHEIQFVTQSPDRDQLWWSSNAGDTDRQHIW